MPGFVDPVLFLVDRIADVHPAPAYFAGFELEEWDDGAEGILVSQGVFIETTHARSARCGGCEFQCNKSVVVRLSKSTGLWAAYIECDEEPSHGRVPAELEQLRRYQASVRTLAQPILKCLKLAAAHVMEVGNGLQLGHINGRFGERNVDLVVRDRRVLLLVGDQEMDLGELMSLKGGKLAIDKISIKRLSNRKPRRPRREDVDDTEIQSPTRRQAQIRAERNRQIRQHGKRLRKAGRSWPQISEEIAGMLFIASPSNGLKAITAETIRRILATSTGR